MNGGRRACLKRACRLSRAVKNFLREGGELYDLRGRRRLSGLGALPAVAVARDRDRAVQLVELLAADADGLLATPAETLSPRQIPQRDALAAALLRLDSDFDL